MKIGGGSKGKTFSDRELAGEVRNLGLKKLKVILGDNYEDVEYQKQILLRLAPSLLPRLNEHSGEGGGPIQFIVPKEVDDKFNLNDSTPRSKPNSKRQTSV